MHNNYIYILHLNYNFRVLLINDAIIEMDCNMEALVIVNVAADIEVRDVILVLMPRLHTALVMKGCDECTLYHPAKLDTDAWNMWTKKQPGSTCVGSNVLVN